MKMNGPIKMYRTREIVRHNITVELPKCMYTLKNIHSTRKNGMVESADHVSTSEKKLDIFDQVKQFLKNNHKIPGMAELEAKQEDILKQLAELKNQILSMKSNLKIGVTQPTKHIVKPTVTTYAKNVNEELSDIVINVNPMNPPYSLGIVQKLLSKVVTLVFSVHQHSTVCSLPEEAKTLQNSLVNFTSNFNTTKINIRLIWKNVGTNTELLVSHVPILGEVNLLRYLARAIKSPLSYDSESDCVEIDSILDLCYLIVRAKTKTERTSLLQSVNKSLGKSQWLFGRRQASVADIAAYSAIKQVMNVSEINVSLGKWFQRCDALLSC